MPFFEVDIILSTIVTLKVEAPNAAAAATMGPDEWLDRGPHMPDHEDRAYTTEVRRVERVGKDA